MLYTVTTIKNEEGMFCVLSLVIRHLNTSFLHSIILSTVACLVLQYVSTLSRKCTIFWGKKRT
jgi:hypothetical protein